MNSRGAIASLLGAAALLGGCTTVTPIDVGGTDHIAGWNSQTRTYAGEHWLYAQLAMNAYQDNEAFTLPGNIVQRFSSGNDATGYAYVIFDRFEGNRLAETIIAYRGTDPNFSDGAVDVALGSIAGAQHERGLATARAVYAQLQAPEYAQTELTVTGHSLGGGIAHHVSDNDLDDRGGAVTRSSVFNNAPRVAGFRDATRDRTAIVERGDFLGVLRALGHSPSELHKSVDCQPGFNPGRDHSMRDLAECLTWIAAFETTAASVSIAQNPVIARPASQPASALPSRPDVGDSGILVNADSNDAELAWAMGNRLRESDILNPLYGAPAGYRVNVDFDAVSGLAAVVWQRNGVRLEHSSLREEHDCSQQTAADCADSIIGAAEAFITLQLRAVNCPDLLTNPRSQANHERCALGALPNQPDGT